MPSRSPYLPSAPTVHPSQAAGCVLAPVLRSRGDGKVEMWGGDVAGGQPGPQCSEPKGSLCVARSFSAEDCTRAESAYVYFFL